MFENISKEGIIDCFVHSNSIEVRFCIHALTKVSRVVYVFKKHTFSIIIGRRRVEYSVGLFI